MSTLAQHTAHFAEPLLEILEVAYTKCRRDSIERFIGIGECEAIFTFERDDVGESQLFNLLSPHGHHSLRYVGTDEFLRMKHLCCKNGEVASSRGDVEKGLWL